MNYIIKLCNKWGLLQSDIDYHLVRASMVLIFLLFGYQKWFEYEAKTLIPFISNGLERMRSDHGGCNRCRGRPPQVSIGPPRQANRKQ